MRRSLRPRHTQSRERRPQPRNHPTPRDAHAESATTDSAFLCSPCPSSRPLARLLPFGWSGIFGPPNGHRRRLAAAGVFESRRLVFQNRTQYVDSASVVDNPANFSTAICFILDNLRRASGFAWPTRRLEAIALADFPGGADSAETHSPDRPVQSRAAQRERLCFRRLPARHGRAQPSPARCGGGAGC